MLPMNVAFWSGVRRLVSFASTSTSGDASSTRTTVPNRKVNKWVKVLERRRDKPCAFACSLHLSTSPPLHLSINPPPTPWAPLQPLCITPSPSSWPETAAQCSSVRPSSSRKLRSAPPSTSTCTHCACPASVAWNSAVLSEKSASWAGDPCACRHEAKGVSRRKMRRRVRASERACVWVRVCVQLTASIRAAMTSWCP